MSLETFANALETAAPALVISEDPFLSRPPSGHAEVSFQLVPVPGGVRLSIMFGDGQPYRWEFASEQQAAALVGRLFDPTP